MNGVLLHPTDELPVASSWQNVTDDTERCPKELERHVRMYNEYGYKSGSRTTDLK